MKKTQSYLTSKTLVKPLLLIPALLGGTVVMLASSPAPIAQSKEAPTAPKKTLQALRVEQSPSGGAALLREGTAITSTLHPCTGAPQDDESNCSHPSLVAQVTEPVQLVEAPLPVPAQQSENQPSINKNAGNEDLGEVTPVSQLSDVQPTDWAYQALSQIMQKYGCLHGYPDGTFKGERAITRYEFATGLNACLKQIEALMTQQPSSVSKKDFDALQKLVNDFRAELAILDTRVGTLETRTHKLEANQFSTTTQLKGEVLFDLSQVFGDKKAVPSGSTPKNNLDSNLTLGDRIRLSFETKNLFKNDDQLRVRVQAGNIPNLQNVTGTNMARLGHDVSGGDNSVVLERLRYKLPLGKLTIYFEGKGGDVEYPDIILTPFLDYTYTKKPKKDMPANINCDIPDNGNFKIPDECYTVNKNEPSLSSGTDPLFRFDRFSPIYRIDSGTSAGVVLIYKFNVPKSKANPEANSNQKTIPIPSSLSVGYLTANPNNPANGNGFFNGGYGALAQYHQNLGKLDLALTYSHRYGISPVGTTGSTFANEPFGSGTQGVTTSNSYGLEARYKVNDGFIVAGWVDDTNASSEVTKKNANIFNWAISLAFPTPNTNSVFGLVFGQSPKVISNDNSSYSDRGTSYQLETFYRHAFTPHLEVTPGILVIINPENNNSNSTIYAAAIRTRFSF